MDLRQQLKTCPTTPGVYLFQDAHGKILYVGKAKMLRTRVRSYFRATAGLEAAKQEMVKRIHRFETISTTTEHEALVLEANLIQKHQPPYNVILRDDKFYLFIKITTGEPLPRVFLTRRLKKDDARYFGPYSSARSVRHTMRLLQRLFPHRGEKESKNEWVFPHPLFSAAEKSVRQSFSEGGLPDKDLYHQNIQNIIRFLNGDRKEIIATLRRGMEQAAAGQHFEQAQLFRDQLQAITALDAKQNVYLASRDTVDVISVASSRGRSAANIFSFRGGKLLVKNTFLLRHRATASPRDIVRQFILQYYQVAQDVPRRILLPLALTDAATIARWINPTRPPLLAAPQRGRFREIIAMGKVNATQVVWEDSIELLSSQRRRQAVKELASSLGLAVLPRRIETYDVSNIHGSLATGSLVVFIDGQPQPSLYRRFRIRLEQTPNPTTSVSTADYAGHSDYAMLQQVLVRRFSQRHQEWPLPDLIIIDGGKGQLSAAKKILDTLGVNAPVIALAKREEEIFRVGQKESLRLPPDSEALFLLQRMRDEAHRFTITYHRHLRSTEQKRSILDEIPGIGPKTKRKLLHRFGSLKALRKATEEDLADVVGGKAALLKDFLY